MIGTNDNKRQEKNKITDNFYYWIITKEYNFK